MTKRNARRKIKPARPDVAAAPREPIVPAVALANGDYRKRFITHVETNTKAETFVSSHDAVARWDDAGRLTDNQLTVIAMLRRLWELTGLRQRITASYGERIPGVSCNELAAINEIEAREDLKRIEGYFPGALRTYFSVFENICRHGMTAGLAGAALSTSSRTADARAHQVVCFVADIIATNERV